MIDLHAHGTLSFKDGIGTMTQIADRLLELDRKVMVLTDHDNIYSAPLMQVWAKPKGLKCIYGCEIRTVKDIDAMRENKQRKKNHLTLLAKTTEGYGNICKLVTFANMDGHYYFPTIDFDVLETYKKDIIVLSGCPSSYLYELILGDDLAGAVKFCKDMKTSLDSNFYIEVMPHDLEMVHKAAPVLRAISKKLDIPMVLTNDSHFLSADQSRIWRLMRAIRLNTTIDMIDDSLQTCYYMTDDEAWAHANNVIGKYFTNQEMLDMFNNQEKIASDCFPPGTKILTGSQTTRNIEDLVVGDQVLTYNVETSKKELKPITKVFERKVNNLVTIRFSNGNEIKCTDNHPIAVNKKGKIKWTKASDLKLDDECIQKRYASACIRMENLKRTDKSRVEIFGKELAEEINIRRKITYEENGSKLKQSSKMKFLHSDPTSRYNSEEYRKLQSEKSTGREMPFKGKSYEEIYGVEGAKIKRIKQGKRISQLRSDPNSKYNSEEGKRNKSEAEKNKWKNDEYRERRTEDLTRNLKNLDNGRTNNGELKLSYILRSTVPGEFKLNNRGQVQQKLKLDLGGLFPDFVNAEKQKLIQYNGCSWHGCEECGIKHTPFGFSAEEVRETDAYKQRRLERLGWQVLSIWEHEKEDVVKQKVKEFTFNPEVEIVKVVSLEFEDCSETQVHNIEVEDNNNYFAYGILVHNCNATVEKVGSVDSGCENPYEELVARTYQGLIDKGLDKPAYRERLEKELDLVGRKGFSDYFLVVADLIKWCKSHDILCGSSRGSAGGFLTSYCLDIIDLDPIPFDLVMERFLSEDRVDPPDIDLDFQASLRDVVIKHLQEKYGENNVAHITTFQHYKGKNTLIDVGKAYGIPRYEVDKVKNVLLERGKADARASATIEDTFLEFSQAAEVAEKYPGIMDAKHLEGQIRHAGVNAAGILVTRRPMDGSCSFREKDSKWVASVDLYGAELIDTLKLDILGIKELDILKELCQSTGVNEKDIYHLPLDDRKVLDIFEGNTLGVFQFGATGTASLVKQLAPIENFDDIILANALCLRWDTEVKVIEQNNDGSVRKYNKRIKDIEVGENVVSTSPNGRGYVNEVSHVIHKGTMPVYRVMTKSGKYIDATLDHGVYTPHGWKKVKELSVGDEVTLCTCTGNFGNHPDAWNKGLTKEDSPEVEKYASQLRGVPKSESAVESMRNSQKMWAKAHPEECVEKGKMLGEANAEWWKNIDPDYKDEFMTRLQKLGTQAALDKWHNSTDEEKAEWTKGFELSPGFGRKGTSKDGHYVASDGELALDNWLYANGIEHEPHPKLPGCWKFADQLVNEYYIEYDGMGRYTDEEWGGKLSIYEKYGFNYIIVRHPVEFEEKLGFLKRVTVEL